MAIETGSTVVWLASLWLYAGAAVAVVFVLFGIDRIDEDARGAYSFRPLLVPGILLLWPLVLWRWWTLETERFGWRARYRAVRTAHGWVWLVLALLIPAIFIVSLSARQPWPQGEPAVRLQNTSQ